MTVVLEDWQLRLLLLRVVEIWREAASPDDAWAQINELGENVSARQSMPNGDYVVVA